MASSGVLAILLLAVATAADAATITVVNRCSYTIWPGALPGGGVRLDPGQSWPFTMPAGTAGARVWPRTGCTFDDIGRGHCITGDCAGALACYLSGEQPATLAEYTLGWGGGRDVFDISVIHGSNTPLSFQPVGGAPCHKYSFAKNDQTSTFTCPVRTNYQIVFCPSNDLISDE